MKKAVLFDLDGTLWDVSDSTLKSAIEISHKYNVPEVTIESINRGMGVQKKDSAKIYFPTLDDSLALKLIDEISEKNIENLATYGGNVYPNIEEALIKLSKEYELYIISNTNHIEYIEAFANTSKLKKYFKEFVAAGELNIIKGEAIIKTINKNNINSAVYIGDTIKDKEAANYANIPFVHAKFGFGKDLKSDYSIESYNDLYDVVKNILK